MMSARLVSSAIWQAFHRRSRGAERNALERIFEPAWRGGKSEQSYIFARRTCIVHIETPIFKIKTGNAMLGYPYPRKIHARQ
jgi:hypothetical protein